MPFRLLSPAPSSPLTLSWLQILKTKAYFCSLFFKAQRWHVNHKVPLKHSHGAQNRGLTAVQRVLASPRILPGGDDEDDSSTGSIHGPTESDLRNYGGNIQILPSISIHDI